MKAPAPHFLLSALLFASLLAAEAPRGYYRSPGIHQDSIVFTAEGDLWKVGVAGGVAQRLTTHPREEIGAAISPDGALIAFNAAYEGPSEVYTIPLAGGLPVRRTWEGGGAIVRGWTPQGEILISTAAFSGLPNRQLIALGLDGARRRIPLAQADQGAFDLAGGVLYFTRLPRQSSETKRYQGGTAQQLWKLEPGAAEAVPLTADFPGTSRDPMWFNGRLYFASDRDGTMNLWSMRPDGKGLQQHTRHGGWDALAPSIGDGRIVYQLGADLHVFDIKSGKDRTLDIRIASDLDQLREKWEDKPFDYLSSVELSPDGERVALVSRGRVFVAPTGPGRFVEAARRPGVRYRQAQFLPDGKSLLALSDQTGEVEYWRLPADGIGSAEQVSDGGDILRLDGEVSPDGKWLATNDKNYRLTLWNLEDRTSRLIRQSQTGDDFGRYRFSPDSRWLAFVDTESNTFQRIKLYEIESGRLVDVTSDRYNSFDPVWSADGDWLYFLSDRELTSVVPSPWGPRQPEPFFNKTNKIYLLALEKGLRSPFQPDDELTADAKDKDKQKDEKAGDEADKDKPKVSVEIDADGIERRLHAIPVPPGDYMSLDATAKTLYWISVDRAGDDKRTLMSFEIGNDPEAKPETVFDSIQGYSLSRDRKKLLARREKKLSVHATDKPPAKDPKEAAKAEVDLGGWKFAVDPREELRQMFVDAWRLERDFFYDPAMHGVAWKAMRDKYEALVSRVTDRSELNDLISQMVAELSTLHIFVRNGDFRDAPDKVSPARLGALLERDESAGGYRVERVYQHDPDLPDHAAPLAKPGVDVQAGSVILAVDGQPTVDAPDLGALLRDKTGKQVRLRVRSAAGEERDVIVEPFSAAQESDLLYEEWEYTRRLEVDRLSGGKIGYVHLRAMGSANIAEWARQFYPVYDRKGLILDVRHNRGGNIDSWVLGRLLRRAWFYWKPRGAEPFWNMQYAFNGHMTALINERTASDGEAFAEGFRRLGMGKLIGTRTWGGEIWLSMNNPLVDKGIASAAQVGVYGPEGEWLIEGHGVDPDIVVDNLPRETFDGKDRQLEAAVAHLLEKIEKEPPPRPAAPPYPNKAFEY
ncbi:MAG: protease [Acidobacteria bacterium]|nr:protease [Acidobacteriota bacterium]